MATAVLVYIGDKNIQKKESPVIDILALNGTKDLLMRMTPAERGLFLLFGYASNQVNVLWKLNAALCRGDDCNERDSGKSHRAAREWRTDTDTCQIGSWGAVGGMAFSAGSVLGKRTWEIIRSKT